MYDNTVSRKQSTNMIKKKNSSEQIISTKNCQTVQDSGWPW